MGEASKLAVGNYKSAQILMLQSIRYFQRNMSSTSVLGFVVSEYDVSRDLVSSFSSNPAYDRHEQAVAPMHRYKECFMSK